MSLYAPLNVLALSDHSNTGSPRRLANRRKALRNEGTSRDVVSSRCTARVDAHVNNRMYALVELLANEFSFLLRINIGPAKSRPTCVNGGSSATRLDGKSGMGCARNGVASAFLQRTHFLKIRLTVTRPLNIQ